LRANQVPATLFINDRWADANRATLLDLAADPLFEIANHGTEHRPLSVSGAEVYGIEGTSDPAGVIAEVGDNQASLAEAIGEPPAYFRAGTAYYDEIAVEIANDMGLEVVGFDILGDAGATFSADQVAGALRDASAGSIALLHMNHPGSGTAAGIEQAVADLRGRGFEFVTLSEFPLAE
jgi:peptidoglycan/xylan/chitin deacetylase (PgdA/CDA1 family)